MSALVGVYLLQQQANSVASVLLVFSMPHQVPTPVEGLCQPGTDRAPERRSLWCCAHIVWEQYSFYGSHIVLVSEGSWAEHGLSGLLAASFMHRS